MGLGFAAVCSADGLLGVTTGLVDPLFYHIEAPLSTLPIFGPSTGRVSLLFGWLMRRFRVLGMFCFVFVFFSVGP